MSFIIVDKTKHEYSYSTARICSNFQSALCQACQSTGSSINSWQQEFYS